MFVCGLTGRGWGMKHWDNQGCQQTASLWKTIVEWTVNIPNIAWFRILVTWNLKTLLKRADWLHLLFPAICSVTVLDTGNVHESVIEKPGTNPLKEVSWQDKLTFNMTWCNLQSTLSWPTNLAGIHSYILQCMYCLVKWHLFILACCLTDNFQPYMF